MKKLIIYLYSLYIIQLATHVSAATTEVDADKRNRLEELRSLNLEELSKVKIKLDDAFDIFGGLVKAKRTTVATGAEQITDRAPSVTTVITSQDIEAMGARTMEEILRTVPGMQISYNLINVPNYTIRGISSIDNNPEVLVLVNGIRLNDSYQGSKGEYWDAFPISAISRVEIIRGPGSAVYGADAFSGVVNIITKTAKEINGTEVGVRVGNLNTKDGWVLHGNQWNGFDIALMAEFASTDGNRRTVESDSQTVWDEIFGTHASLAPGPYGSEVNTYDMLLDVSNQHWQLRTGIHRGEDMGNGIGAGQALEPNPTRSMKRINADLTYSDPKFTDNWDVQAQLNYLYIRFGVDFTIFPPGAFGGAYPIGYISKASESQDNMQLALSGFYRGFDKHLIRIGTGYANYDLFKVVYLTNAGLDPFTGEEISPTEIIDLSDTPAAYSPEVARNNKYLFLQDTWTINKEWELTTGIRYDRYSDFGSTTNPRLGLVWKVRDDLTTKLLYGRAFRAPAFAELYNQNNPASIGNPNLKPENIETWELAFDYRAWENVHLSLNLFNYNIDDKITVVPRGNSELGFANAANWKGKGAEFELRWKTSLKSSLLFNYSYQNSKDVTSAQPLSNAAKQFAFLRADYLIGSYWYIDGQVHWTGDWTRGANDPRSAMKGYTTADLIIRRKDIRGGHTNFAFGIRNLFNADVRYPSPGPGEDGIVNVPNDLPGNRRFFFGEFRYQFD